MSMLMVTSLTVLGLALGSPIPAHAYIGPGIGAGTIGVILGCLASIGLAFFALIVYPLKRFFERKKKKSQPREEITEQ